MTINIFGDLRRQSKYGATEIVCRVMCQLLKNYHELLYHLNNFFSVYASESFKLVSLVQLAHHKCQNLTFSLKK